ncbi:glutathione S-transferase U4 [Podospora australis]|uniref:Glutathione S-transferase U4 n=1 Tax=Podospora australis TaxID=1536484 RepID=A0AAN6WYP3_9PEZI|nr:glutathione S-transferase U4 [Podospora australis]
MGDNDSAMVGKLPQIVLYHYPFSPYARRVIWYLKLRGLDYMECVQPPTLPRPHLSSLLGITYRRIPLAFIGDSIVLDTRLILSRLEADPFLSPSHPPLSAPAGSSSLAIQRLLSVLTTSTDLFFRAAELLPPTLPLLKDPKFLKDRADFFQGKSMTKEERLLSRAEAVGEIRDAMSLLENSILEDGRTWVLGTEKPSLADIEGVWIFHWVLELQSLDADVVNQETFPRVFAWVRRFREAVKGAKGGEVKAISGEEAAGIVLGAKKGEEERVGEKEPVVKVLGLKRGSEVEVYPTDSGSGHRDTGKLVGLDSKEVVWENERGVRVRAPRKGFRVVLGGAQASL